MRTPVLCDTHRGVGTTMSTTVVGLKETCSVKAAIHSLKYKNNEPEPGSW